MFLCKIPLHYVFVSNSFSTQFQESAAHSLEGSLFKEIAHDNGQGERSSWKFCNVIILPRSLLFVTHCTLMFILLNTIATKFSLTLRLVRKKLGFSLFGPFCYLLPNEQLWTRWVQLGIASRFPCLDGMNHEKLNLSLPCLHSNNVPSTHRKKYTTSKLRVVLRSSKRQKRWTSNSFLS